MFSNGWALSVRKDGKNSHKVKYNVLKWLREEPSATTCSARDKFSSVFKKKRICSGLHAACVEQKSSSAIMVTKPHSSTVRH